MLDPTTALFVLPESLVLARSSEFAPEVAQQLVACPEDYVLTLRGTRNPSKVVDAQLGELLAHFRKPTPIVDAIVAFSRHSGLEPTSVLEEAFPALVKLAESGFLVREQDSGRSRDEESASVPIGEVVGGFEITREVQVLPDSAVYQATGADGVIVAIKMYSPSQAPTPHEVQVLQSLNGQTHPSLLAIGVHRSRPYVVLEWIKALRLDQVATRLRSGSFRDRNALLVLCATAARALGELHSQGVIHGDVHPGNMLVDDSLRVRLVDFALADVGGRFAPPRGANPYFMDPQFAATRAERGRPPRATRESDQYSLGAALYFALQGRHYTNFSPVRERLLDQVRSDAPADIVGWGSLDVLLDAVLRRALAKAPDERFASVDDFARALDEVAAASAEQDREPCRRVDSLGVAVRAARDIANLPPAAFCERLGGSTASVVFGAAGVSLGLHRIALCSGDARLASDAARWSTYASDLAQQGPEAFLHQELHITDDLVGPVSTFYGLAGAAYASALCHSSLGNIVQLEQALQLFQHATAQLASRTELMFGQAGPLLAAATLLGVIPAEASIHVSDLRASALNWVTVLLRRLDEGTPLDFLGIAHGVSGELYALLRWYASTEGQVPTSVLDALEKLGRLAQPSGRGSRWPRRLGRPESMAGWCNGSAGLVHLWCEAFVASGEPRFLNWARQAAWDVVDARSEGSDLCCGSAGRAYALLRMHATSGDRVWLDAASSQVDQVLGGVDGASSHRPSLWKGALGVLCVAADLANPSAALMPMM